MTSPQIQHCEHSHRPGRVEAPALTAMVAAMAHLEDALAADPRDTAAFYTDGHGQHLVPEWIRGNADSIRQLLDQLLAQYPDTATTQDGPDDRDQAPALTNPALAVACPACDSHPDALCTSHSGTRTRRHDVHRARTAALAATR
ncbi:zinc finger domain-containing protein [Streptomyces lavendofoliae]|uniref:zinc finger domain-containing protein n=1 Tax=Streptomyces lavendofoliae TaxID=67314 RepID=UPI003D923BE8